MTVDILNTSGKASGTVELPDEIFGIEPNVAVMHQAVKAHLANRRQGTHKTKPRNEVRGGGRKPWRQKGRGTARAGTTRSPLWVGGGNIHGPQPHSYRQKLPRKMHLLARRSALALKLKASELVVVEDLNFSEIRTKPFAEMLKALNASGRKALVLLKEPNDTVFRSARNIPTCDVIEARNASTYQLLDNQVLVIERGSVDVLVEQLQGGGSTRSADDGVDVEPIEAVEEVEVIETETVEEAPEAPEVDTAEGGEESDTDNQTDNEEDEK
jgi:large subunit ribosomal protein L4